MQLEEIYRSYADPVRLQAFFVLNDAHLAEDVCHDIIIRAYQAQTTGHIQNMNCWIKRATKNACIDIIRRRRRLIAASGTEGIDASPEEAYDRLVRDDLIRKAVGRLPSLHQRLLSMAYIKRKSYAEMAHEEGLSEASVRDRLDYARGLLRTEVKKLGLPAMFAGWRVRYQQMRLTGDTFIRTAQVLVVTTALVVTGTLGGNGASVALATQRPPMLGPSIEPPRLQALKGAGITTLPSRASRRDAERYVATPSISVASPMPRDHPGGASIEVGPVVIDCGGLSERRGPVTKLACPLLGH